MPVRDDQHFSTEEELSLIIESVISPYIKSIEKELNISLSIEYISFAKDEEKVLIQPESINAKCKVCLWHTFNENRKVFEVALRLLDQDAQTGYSGFNIKGDIKLGITKHKGMAHVYRQSGYPKW